MAANLEGEVRARERNTRSRKESLGGHEEYPEDGDPADSTSAEESISDLGDFFADLKFALCEEEDSSKALEFLNRAWKIAAKSN